MDIVKVLEMISAEVGRATEKFPTWPTHALDAFAVVQEEAAELQKELLQLTYEKHKGSPEEVTKEAVQLAAMAVRFLMSLDTYTFNPGEQHSQGALICTKCRINTYDPRVGATCCVSCLAQIP